MYYVYIECIISPPILTYSRKKTTYYAQLNAKQAYKHENQGKNTSQVKPGKHTSEKTAT